MPPLNPVLCQHLADTAQALIFQDISTINATKRGGHIYAQTRRNI